MNEQIFERTYLAQVLADTVFHKPLLNYSLWITLLHTLHLS